ncbi:MAG: alpha-1,4-glucan--maltose-1-phosphate maltosyltransferase [Actinomycetales bacterium]|nr:alpha-1,4-glucan--maltose-1-phosphate maltosyltransferase [Actinomycetales bacterium]
MPARAIGRIPVTEVFPVIEDGQWPAKGTVGEPFPVRATVFREGHDAVAATAVLIAPDGTDHSWAPMRDIAKGLDRYEAWLCPDAPGLWGFRVEGWSDPYATWVHDATIKVDAGVDVELMLTEGARLLTRAADRDLPDDVVAVLRTAAAILADTTRDPADRLAAGLSEDVVRVLGDHPLRDMVSPSVAYPLQVDRRLAQTGAWYEMFPRSEGAYFDQMTGRWVSGTFRTAMERIDAIAAMGFDVLYLTPIHPIGTTNRKGRNNTLHAKPGDPGSPYGIGSEAGGHDAIHPELGTFEDFDAFVARARERGMEVALDIALQCSPDHPWVRDHPEWFTTRADGTIAFAENPPKKYQDIYPLNFDNDPEGIYVAIRDMLELWVSHGVTLFRVDNPHTKALVFWQRLLTEFREKHPEVVFLAEAFTRPAMMRTLGAVGFHQSYTYFAWRNTKWELSEYLTEVATQTSHMLRPAFWPTTHDILTPFMQQGGTAAFALRAVLAATGAPTYGIYSGYEFVENVARPGVEEQIDNEKYEFKPRDWSRANDAGLAMLLGTLNWIRRQHPALQQLHQLTIHPTSNDFVLAFSKRIEARFSPTGADDTVLVIVNLDPFLTHESTVYLDMEALGLDPAQPFRVHDELGNSDHQWSATPWVRLDPRVQVAHVMAVRSL